MTAPDTDPAVHGMPTDPRAAAGEAAGTEARGPLAAPDRLETLLDVLAHISTGINVALGKGLLGAVEWREGLLAAGTAIDDLIDSMLDWEPVARG